MKNKYFKFILILISISIFCYHILHLITLWGDIPNQIAIHFSDGTSDNWGSKYFLLIMPILSIFIWWLIGLLVKRPEKLNYVNLTEKNKEIQYSRAEIVMSLIQNLGFIALLFGNEAMLRGAIGLDSSFPFWIAIVLLIICFLAPVYLLIWAATLKY